MDEVGGEVVAATRARPSEDAPSRARKMLLSVTGK